MILVGRPAADRPVSATIAGGRDADVSDGCGVGKGDNGETKTAVALIPGVGDGSASCVRSATIGGSAGNRAASQSTANARISALVTTSHLYRANNRSIPYSFTGRP
jgi:hypothetical protein